MEFTPHSYQQYAIDFILSHPACGLLLDLGLGKTVITLTALQELIFDRFEVDRVLIIAPIRVALTTWPNEIEKWDHLRGLTYSVVTGPPEARKAALRKLALVYIINREQVPWLVESGLFDFRGCCIVVDELSSFKSPKAKRFKALRKVRAKAARFIGLTATPASNGLQDLWAQINLIDMGERLGRSVTGYRERYFVPDRRSREVVFTYRPKPGAEEIIYRTISDICVSMKGSDYLKLPDLIRTTCPVTMTPREQAQYDRLKKDLVLYPSTRKTAGTVLAVKDTGTVSSVREDSVTVPCVRPDKLCLPGPTAPVVTASNAAALANKLSQLANGCVYSDDGTPIEFHSQKLDELESIIEQLNGNPVLVAYWYRHDAERIRTRLDRMGVPYADISSQESISKWNAGELQVGLIHPASAGHGLNLQEGGCHLVWFGLTWSLELYAQLNGRLYRQGQQRPVTIQHIVTRGTIDERILAALESKSMTQDALIDAVKATLSPS
ncbi:MAG: DEAD/DEAH box helicase [Oscillospiraceae bacterium]|nr:DEAD/DEAH box helicase [Oscillospiraceae bacterium]